MMLLLIIAYAATGLLAGVLSGLLGLGGGIIIVPALAALFSWQHFSETLYMHMATGTSLAVVMFTTAVATWSQHKRKAVAWELLRYLVPGMVSGAILGVCLGKYLSSQSLRCMFALFCVGLALKLFFAKENQPGARARSFSNWGLVAIALIAGMLSGLLGIGGGAILIPVLMWLGLSMMAVSGTAVACAFPTAVTGATISVIVGLHSSELPPYSTGYIYWPAALILGIASTLAAPWGVALGHYLPETIVKRIFGLVLMLIAWQMCR